MSTSLPQDFRDAYEERAAIMEFDANMTREHAEARAMADVTEWYAQHAREAN